jgi:enamine deaminase RidA (YjgF/YER057c/UK114 family)
MTPTRVKSPWGTTFSDSVSFDGPGRWIFVSGQIGALEDGTIVSETFAAEADQCFARVRQSLEKAGAQMSDVVKILGFVTSTEHYAEYDLARGRAFDGCPPASATVQVTGLVPAARVEIEAIAFIPTE